MDQREASTCGATSPSVAAHSAYTVRKHILTCTDWTLVYRVESALFAVDMRTSEQICATKIAGE